MKKKLSLLLAAMLVMTLVPMSSFAYGKDVSKSYNAEIGDTGKQVIVKYTVNPGETNILSGTVQFDTSNGVEIADVNVVDKDNENIGKFDVANAKGLGTDTVEVEITGDLAIADAQDGQYFLVFSLDFDGADVEEGDYVLNAVSVGSSTKLSISDLKLGTIAEADNGTLAIKVADTDVKRISKDGGKLSEFVISNFDDKQNVVVELDNSVSINTAEVRVDRVKLAESATTYKIENGILTVMVAAIKGADDISVIADTTCGKSTSFTSVVAEVKNGSNDTSATVGEVVDYEVTMKAVAKGKKEIEAVLAGKTSEVEVTLEAVKGTLSERPIYFEIDGAYLANDATSDVAPVSGVKTITDVDTEDGVEFTIMPVNNASKVKFVIKLKADTDAKGGVATLTATGRDIVEDLTVDVLNVEKAFDVETKVTEIRRGESLATADIVITETKAAQVSAGDYITIGLNGRLEFVDKPVIEATNGMKLGDVEWTVKNNYTAISVKVETRSKGEPAEITISDVGIDLATSAIHNKVYSASLYVGDKTTETKANGSNPVTKEYAEFDIVKCVAEYSKMSPKIVFTLGSANYTVDGVVMTLEAPVFTKDNRTMLPIGPLALAMGLEVNYNADTQTATFRDAATGQVVSVKENASMLYNNGIEYKMHTAAVTVNGRIFVPVASITDAFGAKIMWDEATQTVTIN